VKKGTVPPATLLLGPEAYERRRIKDALLGTVPADAVSQHDLAELTLAEILDDARSRCSPPSASSGSSTRNSPCPALAPRPPMTRRAIPPPLPEGVTPPRWPPT